MTVPEETIIEKGKQLRVKWLQKKFRSKTKIECGSKNAQREKVDYRKRS